LTEYLNIAEADCLKRKVGHEPQLWDRAFKMHLNLEKNGTMKLKNWDVKVDLCED
jgi:acetyl-CoA hydrolase